MNETNSSKSESPDVHPSSSLYESAGGLDSTRDNVHHLETDDENTASSAYNS